MTSTNLYIHQPCHHTDCSYVVPTEQVEGIQSNGLPEEHIDTPGEEANYPVEEEVEPTAPETYPSAMDLEQTPKTWASRLSQNIPSGGGKVVVTGGMPSPPTKLPNSMVSHGG